MTATAQFPRPHEAADRLSAHALLATWIRETQNWTFDKAASRIVIALPRWNARIQVDVERPSKTFRHRLRLPARIAVTGVGSREIGVATLAALIADELDADESLLARVLDSTAMMHTFLDERAMDLERLWGADPLTFEDTEQALLVGHLTHPAPKSRPEMGTDQRRAFSPELASRFALRWLAVQPALVRHDSATGVPATALAESLLRDDPQVDRVTVDAMLRAAGGDRTLIPAHPFQVDRLASHPDTADLFQDGEIVDLGPLGSTYAPTTSLRTVYRAAAPWQLKFSLHVSVTNSVRVTLPKELDRAVESARLAATEIGAKARAIAPDLILVQDPAYLSVVDGERRVDELSVLFRCNRWQSGGPVDVTALTTLCQDHPYGGSPRIAAIVGAIAARDRRAESDVAREWFARFCAVVVRSLVRLYLDVGLCFEAHQQNTLLELDGGWPRRGVYRDSQGYFHRAAAHADLTKIMPGIGEATEAIFPEDLADERLVYYTFVNLTLGVINALGSCADEGVLLADLRQLLEDERKAGGRYPATLLDHLLDDSTWPCKANLLTRANGLDELVGDIAEQSVYVTLPNPLAAR